MRRKLVAGNWKMHFTATEAAANVECLADAVTARDDVDVVVCPSYLSIAAVREATKRTRLEVGAQDVFWAAQGAFTGQVSAEMIKAAGCIYCIVGHSETRGRFGKVEVPSETVCYFADSDHTVNLKIQALINTGLRPILCVGETQSERDANMTDAIISTQIERALDGCQPDEMSELVVAYEPVWAIGTGNVCDATEAQRVCNLIRASISDRMNSELANAVRVLYGGSVKESNAKELFHQPDIDGGLVGGASLNPREFAAIVRAA
ncbi:MAG TPA: triose-phosphate isomerase [Fimbriimonadaceae bacterium]|nr:triose-phosphate isomerase [Fimbriimonadaceae bacterium]